jgi:hypothetical protein
MDRNGTNAPFDDGSCGRPLKEALSFAEPEPKPFFRWF